MHGVARTHLSAEAERRRVPGTARRELALREGDVVDLQEVLPDGQVVHQLHIGTAQRAQAVEPHTCNVAANTHT